MDENTWEDDFDNCSSPPFPRSLTTPKGLTKQLLEAHAWVEENSTFANEVAEAAGCPEKPFICLSSLNSSCREDDVLLHVSVPSLFRSWSALRAIRERWDWIYRNFEEDWSNQKCQLHRMMCIKAASVVLETAFLNPEILEARETTEREEEKSRLLETLKELNIPKSLLDTLGLKDEEDTDFDINDLSDSLFHGESEDDE